MKGVRYVLAFGLAAVASACSVVGYDYYRAIYVEPLANSQTTAWGIAEGASSKDVVADLKRAGFLRDNRLLPMISYTTFHLKMRGLSAP